MVWIYLEESTDYLCSQELVELISHSENGLDPSPIAKSTPIVKECCYLEWHEGISGMHQFGQIFDICILEKRVAFLVDILTSCTEAFPVRGLALQDLERAWKMSEADCFSRSCAWPKKSNPSSYSLKMSQQSRQEGDFKSLERLPKWGMIVDGVLYPLLPLERCIDEKGGSYWLTPSTMEHLPVRTGEALENALHRGKTHKSRRKVSGRLNEQVAYPQMWPTPSARDWKDKGTEPSAHARKSPCLPAAVMMATPCASQANKPIREPSPSRQKGEHGEDLQDSIGRLNPESIGKRLSVEFVELLMGYPSKWTDLEDWVIPFVLSKSKKRSKS